MENSTLNFKLPAIKLHQREPKGTNLYLCVVKAREFFERAPERFVIDYYTRSKNTEKGYQRLLSPKSVEKIKNFILSETHNPLLPTAMLVNSREKLEFKAINDDYGYLMIDNPLHIIDGQHRFEAWKSMMDDIKLRQMWGDYSFPVVVLSGFDELKEVEQFFVINSRQKRIKTDLAERNFLALAGSEETSGLIPHKDRWKLHAVKIVDVLNEQKEKSIWLDKIILPADSPDLRKAKIISQSSFVSSLKPLFVGQQAIFKYENGSRPPLEEWADFVDDFWNQVIAKYYPNATNYAREYSLMKTVGVFVLHLVLGKVTYEISQGRPLTNTSKKAALIKTMSLIESASKKRYKEAFWKSKVNRMTREKGEYAGSYSSSVGHQKLYTGIILGGDF